MIFRDSQKKTLIASIAFLAMLVFLNYIGGLKPIKNFLYEIFRYPQACAAKAAFFLNNAVSHIYEIKDLSRENSKLLIENNSLKTEISEFKEIRHENDLLRAVLNLPIARERSLVDAAIIGKDPYFFSNIITINKGADFKISVGMNAVDSNGFLIGKVAEVNSSVSLIRAIFDSSSAVSAIDQETRVQGIVKNDLSDGLIFDMVSQTEKVEENDTIIAFLTGDKAVLPIAKVVSVEKFPNKSFQKIKLSPLSDFKKMEKIFIVLK